MSWFSITFIITLVGALMAIVLIIPGILTRSLLKRYSKKYSGEYILLDNCMIIGRAIRVPGIIVLLKDKIIYAGLRKEGIIYLSDIDKVEQKKSLTYRWALKKRVGGMRVLEIYHKGGIALFFLPRKKIEEWVKNIRTEVEKKR